MPVERVIMAVNSLDLKQVPLENVEILQRMVPTDQEVSFIIIFEVLFYLFLRMCCVLVFLILNRCKCFLFY